MIMDTFRQKCVKAYDIFRQKYMKANDIFCQKNVLRQLLIFDIWDRTREYISRKEA
jgi:hypothetical protein